MGVARLVLVEADGVPGAGGEVRGPVRIGKLPGLLLAQQVVVQLLRALDERIVPRQVDVGDVLERALGDPALVEGDDPVAPGVAAGGSQLGRVLGQDQVAPRRVPAEDRGQRAARRGEAVHHRAVLVQAGDQGVARVLQRGHEAIRYGGQRLSRRLYGGLDTGDRLAGGGHQLHELGQSRSARRVRRLRLLDLDEPAPDRDAVVGRAEQLPGRRHDGVGALDVCGRDGDGTRDRHQGVVGQQVFQVVEAGPGCRQVRLEGIHRGPVHVQAHFSDPADHLLEVATDRLRVVVGREVAEGRQGAADGDEDDQERPDAQADQQQLAAAGADAPSPPTSVVRGCGILAHDCGTAMTMNRGAVAK